jgi:DNA-binding IclR family transcriptional regulator
MASKTRNLVLTESQGACLTALRFHKLSQPKIALEAKLALTKTSAALRALARLGLAQRDRSKGWHATARGKICRFKTVPERPRQGNGSPGPSGRRLLELLDRPMPGREIVEKLGITRQGVRQLLIKLHAYGSVSFGDPENLLWIVMRAGDQTFFLSRDEERVLSVIPPEHGTNVTKMRLATRLSETKVHQALEHLMGCRFVEAFEGLQGTRIYRLTVAGLNHPQRGLSARRAKAPRLPVESDRVRKVLSAILDSGALRIKDVAHALGVPHQSINALMQYLKRKQLVKKSGHELNAPYSLTDEGRTALAEMTRRRAA